jgi:hypothetical protein
METAAPPPRRRGGRSPASETRSDVPHVVSRVRSTASHRAVPSGSRTSDTPPITTSACSAFSEYVASTPPELAILSRDGMPIIFRRCGGVRRLRMRVLSPFAETTARCSIGFRIRFLCRSCTFHFRRTGLLASLPSLPSVLTPLVNSRKCMTLFLGRRIRLASNHGRNLHLRPESRTRTPSTTVLRVTWARSG